MAEHSLQDDPNNQRDAEGKDAEGDDARKLRHEARIAVIEDHGNCTPDAREKMDRDRSNDVIDLELIKHRNREDHNHAADSANNWGFWHMGQFAKDYRRLFGELPSKTLHGG